MSKARGVGSNGWKGKGVQTMKRPELATAGQISRDEASGGGGKVHASASVTALGGQAPTGVGPPLRASAPGDGQHCPPTLCVGTWWRSLPQSRHCPQGDGCCTKNKFAIHQLRDEAAPQEQLCLAVRHTPIDPHMHTDNSPPYQSTTIYLQFIFILVSFAIHLPLPEQLPVLQCSLWHWPKM